MAQVQGVTQLVDGFFEETLAEQGIVPLETVKLLAQAVYGNHGARPAHLGFSEYILQDGNIEIEVGNGEQAPVLRADRGCMRCRISEE